ncbi:MAG: T9SS type A sorting domain-containing protein [Bacteroidetes bacterium]|nr:T9SS type A sorting domain-containing protein [Bacteroidota bacterium]
MKILFPFLFLFIVADETEAQVKFQKTYGSLASDWASTVLQTSDSGFIICGTTSFGAGGTHDIGILKTDSNGVLKWTKTFGGGNEDRGYDIKKTADGGFIVSGSTESFGAGKSDAYLIKIDSIGNLQWSKTYGGTGNDLGYSVHQTNDGGYIVAGSGINNHFYLIKTYSDGNLQWTKTYGGTWSEDVFYMSQTNDGGFILSGRTYSFGAGKSDIYLVKAASDGTLQWSKTFGGTGDDVGSSVQETNDGGYIIIGETNSFSAGNNIYLIKTYSNGNLQWSKSYQNGEGYAIKQTTDGGFIIAGNTSFGSGAFDIGLMKTSSDGVLQWSKTFGGTNGDIGRSFEQLSDGYIIVGSSWTFGPGFVDMYCVRTDLNGNTACNQTTSFPIVTTPNTIVTTPATQVSSGGVMGNPATQTSSGGVETTLCFSNGINELTQEGVINVYPNPSPDGIFTVQCLKFNVGKAEVFNVFGKKIKTLNFEHETFNIDLNAPSGIYFLQLKTKEGTAVRKIIISK